MPNKELYYKWRRNNRCGWCGNNAYGKSLCPLHLRVALDRNLERQRIFGNPYAKNRYNRLKKEGKCVECGYIKAIPNQIKCFNCAAKSRERCKEYYHRTKGQR